MVADPMALFTQMFAIIGHDETEQKKLAEEFYQGILRQVLMQLVSKLPSEKQIEVQTLIATGKKVDDLLEYLNNNLTEQVVSETLTAVSGAAIKNYLEKVDEYLSQTQKEQLAVLFTAQLKK